MSHIEERTGVQIARFVALPQMALGFVIAIAGAAIGIAQLA